MTASSADAQVQPWIAQLQAFFTPEGMGNDVVNSCQVPATLCHVILLSSAHCVLSDLNSCRLQSELSWSYQF